MRPFAASEAGRARRADRSAKCDHTTCPGCEECSCHRKPKRPQLAPMTQTEAKAEASRLQGSARSALRLLDSITSTDRKTRPRSMLEEAVTRGHADLDEAIRSPALNGAVSGGDDPSWRMVDQLTDRHGNLRERRDVIGDALELLVASLELLAHHAALAATIVEELRAIPPAEAKRLLEAESDVQHCVNCGKVVTGTRDDRLRAGRCAACNTYRDDHDGRDRPRSLIDREVAREMAAASTIPSSNAGKFSSQSPEVGQ